MSEVNSNNEQWIAPALEDLAAQNLSRHALLFPEAGGVCEHDGRRVLNLSTNDYLNLSRHPLVLARARQALDTYGAGATASRLITGTLPLHEELEQRLAILKGYPAALLFGAGYLTNCGALDALLGRGDAVFADRLSHASLLDAARMTGARLHRFAHNDPDALRKLLERHAAPRRLIVTESVFSMDGDTAPLRAIGELATAHGALLLVDEAHATGVCGPRGSGEIAAQDARAFVNLSMGTLSKALGGYGGFIACSEAMRTWLVNRARSFIYTTAPPPPVVGAALGALDALDLDPDMGARLLARAHAFRARLQEAGLDTDASCTHIIPVRAGANDTALRWAARLRERGIVAVAIRPPTVPQGQARLRLSLSLAHTDDDLDRAAHEIITAARAEGVGS